MASKPRRHTRTDDFAATRRAFERWRKNRSGWSRTPEPLWAAAVRLARKHGVNPTAKELGLDYYSLKKHLGSTGTPQPKGRDRKRRIAAKPAFVELPLASLSKRVSYAFVLETSGAKLRFEFDSAVDAGNLEAMAKALLKAVQ